MELQDLYSIYQANIKVDNSPTLENINPIKNGDMLVAIYNNREVRGEVSAVYENYYLLKGKNGSSIKVTLDDVTEHYPKNRAFENKTINPSLKKFTESAETTPQKPVEKVQQKKKTIIEEVEEEEEKNSPDNQVDLTIEKIKAIGKLIYYKDIKFSKITEMFEKKLLSKDTYWYLLTEKGNEIHVIRNNDKAFEIQPFMNALVGHFLKNTPKNGMVNEGYGQIKVAGNDNFSVLSNIPQNVHKQLLNSMIALLSGVKK